MIPDVRNVKLCFRFEASPHRIVSVFYSSLISVKLYQEVWVILIIAIRVFENMPGLILIYWCHLYHLQSRMKPSLPPEYLDLIPEPIFMKNVLLHKCCQSHWTFKGTSPLLATQVKADGHPCPKGMQVFSGERLILMGNKIKLARVELSC